MPHNDQFSAGSMLEFSGQSVRDLQNEIDMYRSDSDATLLTGNGGQNSTLQLNTILVQQTQTANMNSRESSDLQLQFPTLKSIKGEIDPYDVNGGQGLGVQRATLTGV